VRCFVISEDKRTLYSGSHDKTIKVWKLSTGVCVNTIKGHPERINYIVMFQPGILCSASGDPVIRLFSVYDGKCIESFDEH